MLHHRVVVCCAVSALAPPSTPFPAADTWELLRQHPGRVYAQVGLNSVDQALLDRIEPGAASAAERLQQIAKLVAAGIRTTVRMDPLFPGCELLLCCFVACALCVLVCVCLFARKLSLTPAPSKPPNPLSPALPSRRAV